MSGFNFEFLQKFIELLPMILPLIIAITFHEAAHGYVASKLGDNTAKSLGRVTFNPLKHVDPLGTIILPGALIFAGTPGLFGYAKPVPVDFSVLRNGKWGKIAVAFAGPGINLILAYISALLMHMDKVIAPGQGEFFFNCLFFSILCNTVLAIFNMLPILPLDGGRILNALLPEKWAAIHAKSERFGIAIVLLVLLGIPMLAPDLSINKYILGAPVHAITDFIGFASGRE